MLGESCLLAGGGGACLTGVCAFLARKPLLRFLYSSDTILNELKARGFDLGHHSLETHIGSTFRVIEKLGAGASGTVWRVEHRPTGNIYAMKRIEKSDEGMNSNDQLETEVACLRKLRHKNIVNLFEVFESQRMMWIILELVEGGELYQRISEVDHFSERFIAHAMKQVLQAVHYMHSNGIVHRDLKLENILLTSKKESADVKVADFGLSSDLNREGFDPDESIKLKNSRLITDAFCGTPICMAPEVARSNAQYGPQCDIWSVGCMTYELLGGKPPFIARTAAELFRIVATAPVQFSGEHWAIISQNAKDLVGKLLAKKPVDRPSAKEALAHDWFKCAPDFHNEKLHTLLCDRHKERQKAKVGKDMLESGKVDGGIRRTMTGDI